MTETADNRPETCSIKQGTRTTVLYHLSMLNSLTDSKADLKDDQLQNSAIDVCLMNGLQALNPSYFANFSCVKTFSDADVADLTDFSHELLHIRRQ